MQLLVRLAVSALCAGCINVAAVLAQTPGGPPPADPSESAGSFSPVQAHHDARHGHDHSYPDRGSVVRDVPQGATVVHYAGVSYRFANGVWYEPRGPAFVVVAPPIGLVVPMLPSFATPLSGNDDTYLYANDTYYRSRPELGGYEVVNAPAESAVAPTAPTAASAASAATAVTATPATEPTITTAAPDMLTAADVGAEATVHPLAPAGSSPEMVAAVPDQPVPNLSSGTAPSAIPPSATSPTVTPPPIWVPAAFASTASATPVPSRIPGTSLYTYPRNGQNAEQQARDRYECYRFAVTQTGHDPIGSGGTGFAADQRSDFQRAEEACFEGLGYTVR